MKNILKRFLSYVLVVCMLCFMFVTAPAALAAEGLTEPTATALYPIDENGWSILPAPTAETKTFYVSSSEGSDSNDGKTPQSPLATVAAARLKLSDPDNGRILLKCGDVWDIPESLFSFRGGKSASEPLVLSYYGNIQDGRPVLKIKSLFIDRYDKTTYNIAIVGVEFTACEYDPNDPSFTQTPTSSEVGLAFRGRQDNILIEDCVFNYSSLIIHATGTNNFMKNITVRRNVFYGTYWNGSSVEAHTRPSAIFADWIDGFLIEENVFDHNGWNENFENTKANMYNHNLYINYNNIGNTFVLRNNIITRGSSHGVHGRAGGLLEDNLFVGNAISLQMGYKDKALPEGTFAIARNNVIMEGRAMERVSAMQSEALWGIELDNLGSGTVIVENNIVTRTTTDWGAKVGIRDYKNPGDYSLTYTNNIQYNWTGTNDMDNPGWLDPVRSVGSYNEDVLGGENSLDAFLNAAMSRELGEWDVAYTAHAVNEYIREGFTISDEPVEPVEPTYELSVTTDKNLVSKGDYFNVSVGFKTAVNSNVAVLTYTYDPTLFQYRGFTPAVGVQTIDVANDAEAGVLKVTLMVADYNTTAYGKALFSAREDVSIDSKDHSIGVSVNFVQKDENGVKSNLTASGSTGFSAVGTPGDITGDGVVDLLDLSDVIDGFGVTSEDPDWSKYKFYDYNNNGLIDIADIAWVASLITD